MHLRNLISTIFLSAIVCTAETAKTLGTRDDISSAKSSAVDKTVNAKKTEKELKKKEAAELKRKAEEKRLAALEAQKKEAELARKNADAKRQAAEQLRMATAAAQAAEADARAMKKAQDERRSRLLDIAEDKLDSVERMVEEWGRASISEVILVPDTKQGRFKLDYTVPTSNYVSDASNSRQGYSASLLERSTELALKARIASDELGTAEKRLQLFRLQQQMLPTTNTTATNTSPITSSSSTNFQAISNAEITNSTTFNGISQSNTPFQDLLGSNSNGTLTSADALKIGVSHKMTEQALNFMAHPADLPGNQRAYFGVAQVSLSPGWRTQAGYIGEVQLSFAYAKETPVESEVGENKTVRETDDQRFPSVFAVFPFVEAQSFDLKNSFRNQATALIDIAGTYKNLGYNAEANKVLKRAEKLQQDIATDTVLPLVVPSADHYSLTFRFDPEAMALLDPTSPQPKGGHRLKPASFPALIVLVCQEEDLSDPSFKHLVTHVETRWIRSEHRHWFKRYGVDWWRYGYIKQSDMDNHERLSSGLYLDEVRGLLSEGYAKENPKDFLVQELNRRLLNLQPLAMGRSIYTPLPQAAPIITGFIPKTINRHTSRLQIHGRNFGDKTNKVTVRIGDMPMTVASVSDNLLTVNLPLRYLPDPVENEMLAYFDPWEGLTRSIDNLLPVEVETWGTASNQIKLLADVPFTNMSEIYNAHPNTFEAGTNVIFTINGKNIGTLEGGYRSEYVRINGVPYPAHTTEFGTIQVGAHGPSSRYIKDATNDLSTRPGITFPVDWTAQGDFTPTIEFDFIGGQKITKTNLITIKAPKWALEQNQVRISALQPNVLNWSRTNIVFIEGSRFIHGNKTNVLELWIENERCDFTIVGENLLRFSLPPNLEGLSAFAGKSSKLSIRAATTSGMVISTNALKLVKD